MNELKRSSKVSIQIKEALNNILLLLLQVLMMDC